MHKYIYRLADSKYVYYKGFSESIPGCLKVYNFNDRIVIYLNTTDGSIKTFEFCANKCLYLLRAIIIIYLFSWSLHSSRQTALSVLYLFVLCFTSSLQCDLNAVFSFIHYVKFTSFTLAFGDMDTVLVPLFF